MKRLPIYLLGLLLVSACVNKNKADYDEEDDDDATELKLQSVSYASPDSSMVVLSAEVPAKGGTPLADSIISYIGENIGGDFLSFYEKTKSAKKAIKKAGEKLFKDMTEEIESLKEDFDEDEGFEYMFAWEQQNDVSRISETDRYITFLHTGYSYQGGAHGIGWCVGTTFDKATGKRIGLEILKNTDSEAFKEMFNKELLDYFGPEEESLEDNLLGVDPENVPLSNMYIENDTIVFMYQPYEIACYAAGMPFARLSFKQMKPYLNKKGLKLFGKGDDDDDEE